MKKMWFMKPPGHAVGGTKLLRVMKLIVILLVACGLNLSASVKAQKLDLKIRNGSMLDVLKEIEKQSHFRFAYSADFIELNNEVNLNVKDQEVTEVLDQLLEGTNYLYRFKDDFIIFLPKQARKAGNQIQQEKDIVVKGKVSDVNGEPLPGVNVFEKSNPTNGVITGIDGTYNITVSSGDATLTFSYIGFEPQEINASGRTAIDITLVEEFTDLDEVVVVGYGTKKKVNLTGAVAALTPQTLNDRAVSNISQMIQGAVPGVTVIDSPNKSEPSVNIRGRGNLGTSSPLYVVDGMIVDAAFFQRLEPSNIENVSFLKDAASASIYGSRAAYGVILVTTKKAKEGKFRINYNYNIGIQDQTYTPEYVGSQDYIRLYNEAATNSGQSLLPYTDQIDKFDGSDPDHYPDTDWLSLFLDDNSLFQKHSVGASGGDKVKYNLNLAYMDKDGIYKGRNTKRYNLSANAATDLFDFLTIRSNIQYIKEDFKNSKGDYNSTNVNRYAPTAVAKHTDGTYGVYEGGLAWGFADDNALRNFEQGGRKTENTERLLLDLAADIKPFEGLVYTPSLSMYSTNKRSFKFQNTIPDLIDFDTKEVMDGTGKYENKMSLDWSYRQRLLFQNIITYSKTIGDHNIDLLGGYTYEDNSFEVFKGSRKGFFSNEMNNLGAGSSDPQNITNDGYITEYALSSYLGRVNYDFRGKYLVEANIRIDQSSRFHPDNRTGVFPSFSGAWRLSEESFIKSALPDFDNIKLRASWGQLGNINNVDNYDYFELVEITSGYNFEDQPAEGAREGKIANPNLTWETVTITDFGMDLDWRGGLVSLTADYYNKTTNDILLDLPVPWEMGLRDGNNDSQIPSQNAAQVVNKGIELILTHSKKVNADFNYSIGVNFTRNWNEIKDLKDKDPIIDGSKIMKVGQSVGTFYGYKTDGLYSQEDIDNGDFVKLGSVTPEAGQIKYIDRLTVDSDGDGVLDAGDGVINADDRTYLGQDVPDINYGINLRVGYKNFELSVAGQGVEGVKVYLNHEASRAFFNGGKAKKYHLERWTAENPDPNAVYPKLTLNNNYDFEMSDFWLFSADYFRVKNIKLAYNIPKELLKKIGVSSCKVYFSGDNLFTIHGDKRMGDFDPELSSTRSIVPGLKVTSFGINIGL